jgi:hypothetical protein
MHACFLWGDRQASKTIDPTDINVKPGVLTEINISQRGKQNEQKKMTQTCRPTRVESPRQRRAENIERIEQ